MNLTDADTVFINGKEVQQICINGNIVYSNGYRIRLTSDKEYILPGETVTISVNCEDLPYTQIELYGMINMTRTLLDTLETDENGQATYEYTGVGSGEIGFVAVYDDKESNTVVIDDYTPVISSLTCVSSSNNVKYGTPVTFTATVKDQHDRPIESGTVTFKNNNVSIGTASITNGVATLIKSDLDRGDYSITANINSVVSSPVALTVNKLNAVLTINTPALVYSDEFDVTGVLVDEYNNPIANAIVYLDWDYEGSDLPPVPGISQTDSNGEVTFHSQAPTSITDYTFQMWFEDRNYNKTYSSEITVTVGKETSVLNVTSPISQQNIVQGGTIHFEGTLLDNDGSVITNSRVRIICAPNLYDNDVVVGSDGSFSVDITNPFPSGQDKMIMVIYYGNTYYTSSTNTFTVNCIAYDGIDLDSDKSILSKADNEYATLTAQLTYEDTPVSVSGETVTFEVRKESDDSLVETLTGVTDSSGIATVSYYGKGANYLYIQANCRIISNTVIIEDIFYYNPLTEDRGSYDNTSNLNITYSDNGMKILGTKSSDVYTKNTDITLPNHYSIEMTVTGFNGGWNTDICVETMFLNNAQNGTIRRFSSMSYDDSKGFGSYSVGTVVKFVYNASTQTLQLYYDGVLKKTMTSLPSNHIQQFKTYTGRYLTVKDLKVREL